MTKKKKKKRAQLPFRLNVLFFSVFLLFLILVLQLGLVQILNGETYQAEIDKTTQDITNIPVPRGKIFDRNYELIVDNEPLYAITYTPPKRVQHKEKLKVAKKLINYMSMEILDENGKITGITDRNMREYWYLENTEKAESLLPVEEREGMTNSEQYTEVLNRIPDEEIDQLTNEELQIIAIKKELDKAYELTPQIIKNEGVTIEEYSRIAEHLDELPGINVVTDWDRTYPKQTSFNAFLGSITSQNQGILEDKEQYYLTRGYSRNDRVGRSGLEQQYEEVLRGRKEQIEYITNKNGKVIDSNVLVPGERGKDLVLTIDFEYNERLDKIIKRELATAKKEQPQYNENLKDALAVVMDPKSGEILAISGQHFNEETNEIENASLKALHDAHLAGSAIKGATMLAGYDSGVITPNRVIFDEPLYFKETPRKASIVNMGNVNDLDALERSSNVYMYRIAMEMGGVFHYKKDMPLVLNSGTYQRMLNYFHQFGLGTSTDIDYPNEGIGYEGETAQGGLLLDYAIGQYNSYTTLQLAQYVSTIANDGYRVKPRLVKEIREPSPYVDDVGPIYRSMNTEVLNRVDVDISYIKRVQEGFRRAFQGPRGTGSRYFSDREYNPAGKTGTAQVDLINNIQNMILVGYAPFDNPEVAFAVMVPGLGTVQYPINHYIGQGILDEYFNLKKEREQGKTNQLDDESAGEEAENEDMEQD